MTVIYDKLSFVRRLEQDGAFSRPQAEALSEAVHGAMSESVATKSDLAEVRHEMVRMESQMAQLRSELKIWMGSVAAGLFAALFTGLGGLMAIFKFLIH